ncbi:MAG: GUN4 domain-containing protein [Cyanobacteria bacterium]|nr:GUN4 domain-containing protein [Cyanobacteria bacterium bin.51]
MISGPSATSTVSAEQLLERFLAGSTRQRRSLLPQLERRALEVRPLLLDGLGGLDATGDDWAAGALIQLLLLDNDNLAAAFLSRYPQGWLEVSSAEGIDYEPLQSALIQQRFEEADRLTSALLRRLAGPAAEQRGYVYFSEVPAISAVDLVSLDRLWICYSLGRFGFSVQARLLRSVGGRWPLLWPKLGWKTGGTWTRYPSGFTWSLQAPEGHMPLINQLRGVRLIDALLCHPALQQRQPS